MKQYEAGRSQQRALLYDNMSYSVKYTNALKNWRGKKKDKKDGQKKVMFCKVLVQTEFVLL